MAVTLVACALMRAPRENSFGAGTLILMPDGSQTPIEMLRPGDKVLTRRNEADPALVPGEVTQVSSRQAGSYLVINYKLKVTPTHKLRVDGDWQGAGGISQGQMLLGHTNQPVPVQSIYGRGEGFTAYNIHVAPYRTFFADGVWVHQ